MLKSLIEANNIYKSYHQGGVEIKVLKNFLLTKNVVKIFQIIPGEE